MNHRATIRDRERCWTLPILCLLSAAIFASTVLPTAAETSKSAAGEEIVSKRDAEPAPSPDASFSQVRSDIFDLCLNQRWEFTVNPRHPAGPWLMIRVDATKAARAGFRNSSYGSAQVIRAGDRVTVEQRTAVLDARFSAIALSPAGMGDKLRVRLTAERTSPGSIGGLIFEVRATGKGKALWIGKPPSPAAEAEGATP